MKLFTKLLLVLSLLVGAAGVQAQTTATLIASSLGLSNSTSVDGTALDIDSNISAVFAKGTGSTAPAYYTTGTALRLYKGNTLTISAAADCTITNVVLTMHTTGYVGTISANSGTYTLSGTTGSWTGSANSVVLTTSTSHARIQSIQVTYVSSATPVVAAPTITPETGTYTSAQTVTITAPNSAYIRYSLDGNDPDGVYGIDAYSGETFSVDQTTTVMARAYDDGDNKSDLVTSVITIQDATPSTPTVTTTMTYDYTSSTAISGWGLTPPATGAETQVGTTTLAVDNTTMSATSGSTPTRFWNTSGSITLRVYNGGSLTFATTDGSNITKIVFAGTSLTNLSATGYASGTWTGSASSVTFAASGTAQLRTATLTIESSTDPGTTPTTVTAPTITENSGTVTISADANCSVYYTIDGSAPDNTSTLYTQPFTLDASATVKAIAYDASGNYSSVASLDVTIVAPVDPSMTEINLTENFDGSATGTGYNATTAFANCTTGFDYTWTATGSVYALTSAVKFGTSSNTGSVTTSDMLADIPVGTTFTVTLYSAAWNGDSGSANVTYNGTTATLAHANSSSPIKDGGTYAASDFANGTTSQTFTKAAGVNGFTVAPSSKRMVVDKIVVTYTGIKQTAAPVITPAAGTYFADVNVSMSAEDGCTIYYTTNGTEPDNTSAQYSAPFTLTYNVGNTVTVKAIAYDANGKASAVTTNDYVFGNAASGYTTVKALFDIATATATPVTVTMNNWVVNGVNTSGNNAFVVDQNGDGLVIFNNAGTGLNEGDHLSGTFTANVQTYHGACELTGITSATTGLTVTAGSPNAATEIVLSQLDSPLRMANMVLLKSMTWNGTTFEDPDGVTIAWYDTFTAGLSFVQGTIYDLTGMINYYDKFQISLKDASGLQVVGSADGGVPAPVINPGTGTFLEAQTVSITAATGCTIYYTLDGSIPSTSSTQYTAPFEVAENTTVKAIAYNADNVASSVSVAYITIDPNATGICQPMASAIPAGFYTDIDGLYGEALKMAVCKADSVHTDLGYGGLWPAYETSDVFFYTDDMVVDYYNDIEYHFSGTGASIGAMNREHVCARSWWSSTDSPAYPHNDLFQVLPSDANANGAKSNYPLGTTSSASYTNPRMMVGPSDMDGYTGTVFEPCDEYKGDFARIYFYVSTMYWGIPWKSNSNVASTVPFTKQAYPTIDSWILQMLLDWNAQDPVSQWEVTRNEKVFGIQGNRNPFVDYPQLADHIWGSQKDVPFSLSTAVVNGTTEPLAMGLLYPASVDPDYVRDVALGHYGTLCVDFEIASVTGATLYTISDKEVASDGTFTGVNLVEQSLPVPAGQPVIFKATADQLVASPNRDAAKTTAQWSNFAGLYGNLTGDDYVFGSTDISDADPIYILSGDMLYLVDVADMAGVRTNRAYVRTNDIDVASGSTGARVRIGCGDAAAIQAIRRDAGIEETGTYYNVFGQPVNDSARGVIIRSDGKKIIRK